MPKDTRVSLTVFRTINLGNYENIKVEAGVEENLEPGETYAEAYERLWQEAKTARDKAIQQELDELQGKSKESERKSPNPVASRFRVPTVPE